MANNRVVVTNWTTPRQAFQRNRPGSMLFSFWQCGKKNHGWREGRR
jgi:hypothetical protein